MLTVDPAPREFIRQIIEIVRKPYVLVTAPGQEPHPTRLEWFWNLFQTRLLGHNCSVKLAKMLCYCELLLFKNQTNMNIQIHTVK